MKTNRFWRMFTTAFALGLAAAVPASPPEVEKLAAEMAESGAEVRSAYCDRLGVFIVAIGRVSLSDGSAQARDKARTIARMNAKDAISGFVGNKIKTSATMTSAESTSGDKTEESEYFSKMTAAESEAFLKGLQTLWAKSDGKQVEFAVYITAKTQDASQMLKDAVDAMGEKGTVRAVGVDSQWSKAEQKALRSAVEQVIGTLVVGKASVKDGDELKSKLGETSAGLVEEYRIAGDEKLAGDFKVTVLAKVSKKKIYENYSSYFKALSNPVFFIRSTDKELVDSFTQYFINKGVRLTADPEKAHYYIDLDGKFTERANPLTGKMGTMLSVSVEVREAGDGSRVLMKLPRKTAAKDSAVLTKEQRQEAVAKTVFSKIKDDLDRAFHDMVARMLDEAE